MRAIGVGGVAVAGTGVAGARGPDARNFRAHLTSEQEVEDVDSDAQGQAVFQLDMGGGTLNYKLIVANIENVLMAHIHNAPAGENGPIVAWLYPEGGSAPNLIEGRVDGILAKGTVMADDLVGPLAGMSLETLVQAIEDGNTYVNVHTQQHGGGEVRGQIH